MPPALQCIFFEASITPVPKLDSNLMGEEGYRLIFLLNTDTKMLKKCLQIESNKT
jgi:hypothetical protein